MLGGLYTGTYACANLTRRTASYMHSNAAGRVVDTQTDGYCLPTCVVSVCACLYWAGWCWQISWHLSMDALIIESMTSTSEVQESKTYDVQAYSRPLLPDADLYTDSLVVRLCGGGNDLFMPREFQRLPMQVASKLMSSFWV